MAIIDGTLHLTQIWLSESLIDEARAHPSLSLGYGPFVIDFNRDGRLSPQYRGIR